MREEVVVLTRDSVALVGEKKMQKILFFSEFIVT